MRRAPSRAWRATRRALASIASRASRIVEFVASRETMIIDDTRGLQKDAHVHAGDRLMLQIQFSKFALRQ